MRTIVVVRSFSRFFLHETSTLIFFFPPLSVLQPQPMVQRSIRLSCRRLLLRSRCLPCVRARGKDCCAFDLPSTSLRRAVLTLLLQSAIGFTLSVSVQFSTLILWFVRVLNVRELFSIPFQSDVPPSPATSLTLFHSSSYCRCGRSLETPSSESKITWSSRGRKKTRPTEVRHFPGRALL